MKRLAAPLLAAVLLLIAAAGLSSIQSDEFCTVNPVYVQSETDNYEITQPLIAWPPGRECVFARDGRVAKVAWGDVGAVPDRCWRAARSPCSGATATRGRR